MFNMSYFYGRISCVMLLMQFCLTLTVSVFNWHADSWRRLIVDAAYNSHNASMHVHRASHRTPIKQNISTRWEMSIKYFIAVTMWTSLHIKTFKYNEHPGKILHQLNIWQNIYIIMTCRNILNVTIYNIKNLANYLYVHFNRSEFESSTLHSRLMGVGEWIASKL